MELPTVTVTDEFADRMRAAFAHYIDDYGNALPFEDAYRTWLRGAVVHYLWILEQRAAQSDMGGFA